jgi:hypothetical protein
MHLGTIKAGPLRMVCQSDVLTLQWVEDQTEDLATFNGATLQLYGHACYSDPFIRKQLTSFLGKILPGHSVAFVASGNRSRVEVDGTSYPVPGIIDCGALSSGSLPSKTGQLSIVR